MDNVENSMGRVTAAVLGSHTWHKAIVDSSSQGDTRWRGREIFQFVCASMRIPSKDTLR